MKATTISKMLDEGLIKSYPTDNFKAQLKRAFSRAKEEGTILGFKFLKSKSYSDMHSDRDLVAVQFALSKNASIEELEKEYLNRDLTLLGWYIGKRSDRIEYVNYGEELETKIFLFEPRYPLELEKAREFSKELIAKIKKFYHMTFEKYGAKIEKNGLVPNFSDRKDFIYPERIYLWTNKSYAESFAAYHSTPGFFGGKEHRKDIEKFRVGNTGEIANLKFQKKRQNLLIYEVDLEALEKSGKDIALFHDNRFGEKGKDVSAVFTYNTIPPNFVKLIEKVK